MRPLEARLRAALACLALCRSASGAGNAPDPCPVAPGARTHDGFFARSSPGLAFEWAHVDGTGAPYRSGIRAIGQGGELALGGTPAPGLVLGGSVWTGRLDPVFIEGGRRVSPDDDSVKLTQLRLGPFVDYYPDARSGFHALLGVAWVASFESDTKGDALEPVAYGWSFATGAGYEWFVSSEMSLGFLGRFAFGGVGRRPQGSPEHTLFLVPELALSVTYH
jgi:hypothetical protein